MRKKEVIGSVGYATNITPEAIEKAHESGVDFLLTHHDSWEFVFGLKEKCNQLLEEYGMVHAFFRAPLDDAEFGTSASFASALGTKKLLVDMPYMEVFHCGVIGELPPVSVDEFSKRLSEILREPARCFQNLPSPVHRVAVATGGGNMTTEMQRTVEHGCDTYVTGEYVLYSQQYAKLHNMNLLVGSHTNKEILAVGDGVGRIYRVEPMGYFENDPNLTDKKFPGNPTRSYRTRQALLVVGEVEGWEGHTPEVLQQMLEHMEELKRLDKAINE